MAAELIERGALHRKQAPIRIIGGVGAVQDVESLLTVSIVRHRPPIPRQQRLVAGMGNRGLLQHGRRLATLSGGAQRLAIGKGSFGILGIGAVTFAGDVDRLTRVSLGARRALWRY